MRKYKKVSCHTTKAAAKKKADGMRSQGMTASVRKSSKGGYCVHSAGRRKKRK